MRPISALVISDRPDVSEAPDRPYRYACADHISSLRDIDGFQWLGVISPEPELLSIAEAEWQADVTGVSIDDLDPEIEPDLAVLLTAPEKRAEIVQRLGRIRHLVVEPPLGLGVADSEYFNHLCRTNDIHLHVSGAWRLDANVLALSDGGCRRAIGALIAGGGLFGQGLWHTGLMWIDVLQAIFGEVEAVRALGDPHFADASVIPADQAVPFAISLDGYKMIAAHPIAADGPRGPHVDLWGTEGRLTLSFDANRSRLEIQTPDSESRLSTADYGDALVAFYRHLYASASGAEEPLWTGDAATQCERIVETILTSADDDGEIFRFR